MWEGFVKQVCF